MREKGMNIWGERVREEISRNVNKIFSLLHFSSHRGCVVEWECIYWYICQYNCANVNKFMGRSPPSILVFIHFRKYCMSAIKKPVSLSLATWLNLKSTLSKFFLHLSIPLSFPHIFLFFLKTPCRFFFLSSPSHFVISYKHYMAHKIFIRGDKKKNGEESERRKKEEGNFTDFVIRKITIPQIIIHCSSLSVYLSHSRNSSLFPSVHHISKWQMKIILFYFSRICGCIRQ